MTQIGRDEFVSILKEITDKGEQGTTDYLKGQGIDLADLYDICLRLEGREFLKPGAKVMAGIFVGIELGRRLEFEERIGIE